MPGILGCITRLPRELAEEKRLQMMEVVYHEDFYVGGTWTDESLGVYIGWVAREGSFSDGMPLRNERGDMVLAFSGEEFPEPGTTQSLKGRGHELDRVGCSYLIHLCEEDPAFPAGLNGRFHGFVIDRRRGAALLFNDRYGMHRIYYHESKDGFYFASEAKAILAACPELRRMDPRQLGEFIVCGCTLEGRSLFDGIHVLPGGSKWVFRNGCLVTKERYFKPEEWENQGHLELEPFYREIRDVFSRNLPRFFEGRERIGLSLTGGLDTRMIMAWQEALPGSLQCYTFGGMLRECQDVIVGRQVARTCEQPYQVIRTGEEFLKQFHHYAERAVYLSDGCVDVSRASDLYLNERAREIAPVRMTGNYGGEVLRRVRAFKAEKPSPGLFQRDVLEYIHQAGETYSGLLRGHPLSFAVFKQAPWHHYGILALEETQVSMRSPYLDNDFVRTVFRAPEAAFAMSAVSMRLIADGNAALLQIPTDRGLAGSRGHFLSAASHGILEFLFKAEYAYDMGMPQWMARLDHVLSPLHLERLFLGRHKAQHFRIWYRDPLAEYVRETLLDPRSLSRSYVDRKGLEAVVRGHLKGDRNYTREIHKLLTLELLHRLLLDNPAMRNHGKQPGVPAATRIVQ